MSQYQSAYGSVGVNNGDYGIAMVTVSAAQPAPRTLAQLLRLRAANWSALASALAVGAGDKAALKAIQPPISAWAVVLIGLAPFATRN